MVGYARSTPKLFILYISITTSILVGKVQILPDIGVPDALEGARLASHNRSTMAPISLKASPGPTGDGTSPNEFLRQRRKRKLSAANLTWWPPWVYEMYDCVSNTWVTSILIIKEAISKTKLINFFNICINYQLLIWRGGLCGFTRCTIV